MRDDFISSYLQYTEENECPVVFHRWSALTCLGAWIGGNMQFGLGHFVVKPNLYVMLMGSPGTRKSTAIKIAAATIRKAGYLTIAGDRTTKEKFLLDLAGEKDEIAFPGNSRKVPEFNLDDNLFGEDSLTPAEVLIAADEFNAFIGNGNIEFLSMLGVLWDYVGVYKNRVKNSKSVEIQDPVVSILAGNTPTGFSLAFPVESIGQGIFSRILLVHGEPSGKKITFPSPPAPEATAAIVSQLLEIKRKCIGTLQLTGTARKLLDKIYRSHNGIGDVRFESYSNRRFTHLLKMCIILAAARASTELIEEDVVYANTILTHTEHSMPQALGSFGKARHSDVSHKILQVLDSTPGIVSLKDIWVHVHTDLERITELADLLRNLVAADKILQSGGGFLLRRKVISEVSDGMIDFSFLSEEERKYIS